MIYKKITTETIRIDELFKRLDIPEKENALEELKFPLRVNTPYGFKPIVSAFRTEKQTPVTTYFKNNKTLKTSNEHLLKVNGGWVKIKDIKKNDVIETETGTTSIIRKHKSNKKEIMYDLSVDEVHCYYSNGIVSHNSWILTRAGMSAMKQGKNVLHFTMELNEEYVGLRYDSCFSGIPFQEVRTKKDIVAKSFSDVTGKLVIKFFPLKTITAATLKAHVAHTEMILGIKFDLLVVDYADLLKSLTTNKNSNSYSEGGAVYEELRAVAGELKIPIISASQSQRSQNSEEIIGAEGVADSYKKIMTGDFIFSLSRMTEDKLANTARIHIIKNRLGRDGDSYPCHFDASCGDIRILDPSTVEGMEITKKFKHQQESGKDQIRKKWNQNKDRE